MITETKTIKTNLETMIENLYAYQQRIKETHKYRIYFTDAGWARLSSICGYIVGLAHAGQTEFAEQLADDFTKKLTGIVGDHDTKIDGYNVKVPSRKAILSDDGTLHGFSVCVYYPINPVDFELTRKKHRDEINAENEAGDKTYDTPIERTNIEFKVYECVNVNSPYSDELTEHRYGDLGSVRIYYCFAYNGGFLYHGPGGGETFSVQIGQSLWSMHT